MDSKQGRFSQGLQVISTAEWPRRVNRSELQTEKDLRPVRNFETCPKFLSITDIDSRKNVDLNMTRSYTVQQGDRRTASKSNLHGNENH